MADDRPKCGACGHRLNSDGAEGWICNGRGGCGAEWDDDTAREVPVDYVPVGHVVAEIERDSILEEIEAEAAAKRPAIEALFGRRPDA